MICQIGDSDTSAEGEALVHTESDRLAKIRSKPVVVHDNQRFTSMLFPLVQHPEPRHLELSFVPSNPSCEPSSELLVYNVAARPCMK